MRYIILLLFLIGCQNNKTDVPIVSEVPKIFNCKIIISWVLPTKREDDTLIDISEIDKFTVYASHVPETSEIELGFIEEIDPHILTYTWNWDENYKGLWYFQATITDIEGLESNYSNEISRSCS